MVSGWQQALVLVAVVVPGFVFQGVERRRLGPSPADRELTVRMLRALVASVVFLLLYLIALGNVLLNPVLHNDHRFDHPRLTALTVFVLVLAIPAAAGHTSASFKTRQQINQTTFRDTLVHHANTANGEMTWIQALFSSDSTYSPVPTAWDFATGQMIPAGSFIRVLIPDGTWLGGRAGGDAFFTGYPEPRDLWLDEAWQLDNDGAFQKALPGPTGMWIPCTDAVLLQVAPAITDES